MAQVCFQQQKKQQQQQEQRLVIKFHKIRA